MRFYN